MTSVQEECVGCKTLKVDNDTLTKENTRLKQVLNDLILYAEELEKRVYRFNEKKIGHPYIKRARRAREGK